MFLLSQQVLESVRFMRFALCMRLFKWPFLEQDKSQTLQTKLLLFLMFFCHRKLPQLVTEKTSKYLFRKTIKLYRD